MQKQKNKSGLFQQNLIKGCLTTMGLSAIVSAAPYFGDTISIPQPDRSVVKAVVWGDEFGQRIESDDGYTLVVDPETKWLSYADVKQDSSGLISTKIKYYGFKGAKARAGIPGHLKKHISPKMSYVNKKVKQAIVGLECAEGFSVQRRGLSVASNLNSSYELTGVVKGLTVLVKFPDQDEVLSKDEVYNYLNQPGYSVNGNNGSVHDYYYDVSNGLLDYTNIVEGYYTALHDKSYYEDPNVKIGIRARELVMEAIKWLERSGFDFSQISVTPDSVVRAMNIIYAGSVTSGGLWSHQSWIDNRYKTNNVIFHNYQITNMQDPEIGVFCHETGHQLFQWMDLYDRDKIDGLPESWGVAEFCVMCSQYPLNPQPPNAYYRMLAGWENCVDITNDLPEQTYTLYSNTNNSYKYINPDNPQEMFIIESREIKGRCSEFMETNEGVMIWHVDESMREHRNDYQEMLPDRHYYVSLEQACGKFGLEKRKLQFNNNLFNPKTGTEFNDYLCPNSNWWNGDASHINIRGISEVGPVMTFSRGPRQIYYSLKGSVIPSHACANTDFKKYFNVKINGMKAFTETDIDGNFEFKYLPINLTGYSLTLSKLHYLTRPVTLNRFDCNSVLGSLDNAMEIWIGDINRDGAISMNDVMELSTKLNSADGDQRYDSSYDLNKDGAINMTDVMIIAANFNKSSASYPAVNPLYQ